MTPITWDKIGEREYQTGVDHGVLYLQSGVAVPWNGLTGVEESPESESKSYYLDGQKYLTVTSPGDFAAVLKAITYPDEFDAVNGIGSDESVPGLSFYDQPTRSFSLSYRTKIGNDVDGIDHGYKIHVIYNAIADPATRVYSTLDDRSQPAEFSWNLTARPPDWSHFPFKPTAHLVLDSTKMDSDLLESFEDILYGTESSDPRLLIIEDLIPTG